jgi:hypothetical protein
MWGSNLLERATHVAHAMHCPFDVNRHALAAALSLLATGMLALDACNISLGNWNTPWGCPDAGPAPPNSTTTANEAGCKLWSCDPGFFACGDGAPCAVKLLGDPHNCGACGNDCGGGPCLQGTCAASILLARGLSSYAPIATDATSVYAFDAAFDAIVRIPKGGGAAVRIADLHPNASPLQPLIAADSSGVYWLDGDALWALATGSSQPAMLASGLLLAQGPLLLDPDALYFASIGPPDGFDASAIAPAIWRESKSGGIPEPVLPLLVLDLTIDGFPLGIAGSRVAFADGTRLLVGTVDGGPTTQVASLRNGISALTADDTFIYFTRGQPQVTAGFGCAPPDASCPLPDWADDDAGDKGTFVLGWDGGNLRALPAIGLLLELRLGHGSLWATPTSGNHTNYAVERVDLATGVARIFAGGGEIGGFAVDADGVYWTRDGTLLFVPLK